MGKRKRRQLQQQQQQEGGAPSLPLAPPARTHALNVCSRRKDLRGAWALWEAVAAQAEAVPFSTYECNVVLYLCAVAAGQGGAGEGPEAAAREAGASAAGEAAEAAAGGSAAPAPVPPLQAQQWALQLYEAMRHSGRRAPPNEASFTALARLAAAAGDPALAFRVVRDMAEGGKAGEGAALRSEREGGTEAPPLGSRAPAASAAFRPKLRSYDPALLGFCRRRDVASLEAVLRHMRQQGLEAGEAQLAAVLEACVAARDAAAVYRSLQRLRRVARGLPPATVAVVREWFASEEAQAAGLTLLDGGEAGGRDGAGHEHAEERSAADAVTPEETKAAASDPPPDSASAASSDAAAASGDADGPLRVMPPAAVEEVVQRNGGGWHGLGWVGAGRWAVQEALVSEAGRCSSCGRQLQCLDLDDSETEAFKAAVERLVADRGKARELAVFKEWLARNGPFPAVLDAANIALYKQNFAGGGFSFQQVDAVVRAVAALPSSSPGSGSPSSPSSPRAAPRPPLLVVHHKRTRNATVAADPAASACVAQWRAQGCLFETPTGANDDWYWLYAAVAMRCLLVSNDEMRDHVFATLGSDFFFPKWKERHQVRFDMTTAGPILRLPPSFSFVIQETWDGSWHFPQAACTEEDGAGLEAPAATQANEGGSSRKCAEGAGASREAAERPTEPAPESSSSAQQLEAEDSSSGPGEQSPLLSAYSRWLCVRRSPSPVAESGPDQQGN